MVQCDICVPAIGANGSKSVILRSIKVLVSQKGKLIMQKVEEIQKYGKEQMETAVASAGEFTKGVQAIMTAYGDYSKKAIEDGNAFVGKLSGVKSVDKALEVQTEYAKSSYETFVAESKKIGELYADLAKLTYKPFEGLVAKAQQTANAATH